VPAAHDIHACEDEEEYLPAPQGVHEMAPVAVNVSVTLPAAHTVQAVAPDELL